tara:strand:- start:3059 stop:3547 length:489 start_codon:yes stop_codon:yes gene_type:complete
MVFLTGCIGVETPDTVFKAKPILYIGDSNCTPRKWSRAWENVGIEADCFGGRRLMQVISLPQSDVIFLALGLNDAIHYPALIYGRHLSYLLTTTRAKVYCILPVVNHAGSSLDVSPVRYEMYTRCTNIIDPMDFGVIVENSDGLHWGENDDYNFTIGLNKAL